MGILIKEDNERIAREARGKLKLVTEGEIRTASRKGMANFIGCCFHVRGDKKLKLNLAA